MKVRKVLLLLLTRPIIVGHEVLLPPHGGDVTVGHAIGEGEVVVAVGPVPEGHVPGSRAAGVQEGKGEKGLAVQKRRGLVGSSGGVSY